MKQLPKNELMEKLYEAFKNGYIQQCDKCKSFKISTYVDEDYFSNPLRCECRDCKNSWSG